MTKLKGKQLYTSKNIAMIAISAALIIAIKYAFGFIAGIEFVTFLTVLYAVFFPLAVSMTTSIVFVLMTGIIYGMGYWWIMYWFIFPIETIVSWSLRKFLKKNNVIFATWTGFLGFSIMFWYAIQDWILGGPSLVVLNMSTGVITNTIEAASNFLVALFAFYPCKRFFEWYFKKQEVNLW